MAGATSIALCPALELRFSLLAARYSQLAVEKRGAGHCLRTRKRWKMPAMNEPPARRLETSEQHARLAEIYGKPDPDLSPEQVARRQRLAHYHTMLSKGRH